MQPILRPLSLGEVLDRTFQFYRQKFLLFVGIAIIPQTAVLFVGFLAAFLDTDTLSRYTALFWTGFVLALIFNLVALAISQAATSAAVSDIYLGRETSIRQAYGRIRGNMRRMIGIMLGLWLYTALYSMLLVIPGIYVTLAWALAIPAAVIEGLSFSECRDRSSYLTDGVKGRIFIIFVMVWILSTGVSYGIEKFFHALTGLTVGAAHSLSLTATKELISFIASVLVEPIAMIAFTITYYDQRVRREGFDIEFMMKGNEETQAAVAGNAAPQM